MGRLNAGISGGGVIDLSDVAPVTQAHSDAASAGSGAQASRDTHRHGMPAAGGGGAVVREGGQTTEATTTSTSAVDLLTATGLSIITTLPIQILVAGRKTTGAASGAAFGLKLNTTVVGEAVIGGVDRILEFSTANEAVGKSAMVFLPQRITLYEGINSAFGLASGLGTAIAVGTTPTFTAAMPLATIADVIIRGITSASVTLGADELNVYTLSAS